MAKEQLKIHPFDCLVTFNFSPNLFQLDKDELPISNDQDPCIFLEEEPILILRVDSKCLKYCQK
jgi:hypothetical protein